MAVIITPVTIGMSETYQMERLACRMIMVLCR